MVVHNLDAARPFGSPDEAHAPLVVDAIAALPFAISFQGFQLIARGYAQIFQNRRPVKLLQFAKGRSLDVYPAGNAITVRIV